MYFAKPVLELRPVEAPSAATPGASVYVLLPTVQELLGRPDFALDAPIALPDAVWPLDARRFFGTAGRPAMATLH